MRGLLRVTLGLWVLLCAGSSNADTQDPRTRAALEALQTGLDQFDQGRFADAEQHFRLARDLVPEKANPHYWLGNTLVQEGRCAEALSSLREFLKLVPADHPKRASAIALRDRCEAERAVPVAPPIAAPPKPPAPQPTKVVVAPPAAVTPPAAVQPPITPPPPIIKPAPAPPSELRVVEIPAPPVVQPQPIAPDPQAPRRRLRYAGIGLMAAGAAIALGGGIGFATLAANEANTVKQPTAAPFNPKLDSTGRLYDTLTIVSFAAGGALAATGAVLLGLSLRRSAESASRSATLQLAPLASPSLAGLTLTGAF